MRSVLIAGGTGYVGGRIAVHLAQAGWQVRIASRQVAAAPTWLPSAEMHMIDWLHAASLEAACGNVDCVIHMAALNEHECQADPVAALEVNGVLSARLLHAAVKQNVRRFVYMSTAHVYGAPLQGVLDERTLARPIHPYATSHRAAEDVVLAAHTKRDIEGIVLRLSNGFGAPTHASINRWTLLVNDLCRQAIKTGELKLQSAGLQRRDFIALHDVAGAVAHMLELPAAALDDGLFNLGGAWAPQIIEMARRVQLRCEAVLGTSVPLISPPANTSMPDVSLDYRIDKLRKTGFVLSGDIDAELDATVRLCRDSFRGKQ